MLIKEIEKMALKSEIPKAPSTLALKKFQARSLGLVVLLLVMRIPGNAFIHLCDAVPMPTSLVLPPPSAHSSMIRMVNLTRQHGGDTFDAIDMVSVKFQSIGADSCKCQCLPHLYTFREDLNICVDDIHECTLAPFVSGSTSEKIPFVFLPLRGQIIHPSKEISLQGMKAPVCAISGSQYLTTNGWAELHNTNDLDVPFRLFNDEGRTFLQWLGETDLRFKMQGRLILVHLMCRDMASPKSADAISGVANDASGRSKSASNFFTPCVAFRVAGMPIKHINNVTEVSFQSESTSSTLTSMDGLTAKEYTLIAVCSLILGLIYVASVFLYIHVKRYKTRVNGNNTDTSQRKSDYQPNEEVTFGNGFNRSSYDRSSGSINDGGLSDRHSNMNRKMTLNGLGTEEQGVIKNNPLLKHYPSLGENSGFISDVSNSTLENSGEDGANGHEILRNLQSSIHPNSAQGRDRIDNPAPSPTQETECLPEENVSIIEDMVSADKMENMKAIVSGTIRRKLYFNPAYFEPHLLMSPPPAAVEFLAKIREVISLAKYKMASKRFQPSLIMIPEEHLSSNYADPANVSQNKNDQKSCIGCPGCKNDKSGMNCKNCGDKRNTIRKWLEDVHENNVLCNPISQDSALNGNKPSVAAETNDSPVSPVKQTDGDSNSESDTVKSNSLGSKNSKKRKAPPIPLTAPRIVSHLKKDNHKPRPQPERPAPLQKPELPVVGPSIPVGVNSVQVTTTSTVQTPTNMSREKKETNNNLPIHRSEIYNNPAFKLSSPTSVHRSKVDRTSNQSRQSAKKRVDVLDQYANPSSLVSEADTSRNRSEYEAISPRKSSYVHNIPTPDYDDPSSTYTRKRFNSYDTDETLIPPPDYNSSTLGRKQYQPDSPIYHRKSPHYLIVDYETDSLERSNTSKVIRNSFTPHSNNSSDMSSQPSPSLSSALPLEEEVEIGNTVYDSVEGHRKDGDPMKVIRNFPKKPKPPSIYEEIGSVSKAYMQSSRSSSREPRIKYNTPFQGSMTIEVDHEPTDEELSTDSDQFEPDTLDRKPKKFNNDRFQDIPNNQRSINDWPSRQNKPSEFFTRAKPVSNKDHINLNMSSLPDMSYFNNTPDNQVVLRSSGSFRSNSLGNYLSEIGALMNNNELEKSFSSLREIYEAKNQKNLKQGRGMNEGECDGRILTLEARHSKRQRQTTLEKNMKKILPPEIIPFETKKEIFENPQMRDKANKNHPKINHKKLTDWPTENVQDNKKTENSNVIGGNVVSKKKQNDRNIDDEINLISKTLSTSSNSESTDITGVSENQVNSANDSLKQAYSKVRKASKYSGVYNLEARRASELQNIPNYMNLSDVHCLRADQPFDCNSESSTLKTGSTKFYYKSNLNQEANLGNHFKASEDLDKIDIISSKPLCFKDLSADIMDNTKHLISELANDTSTLSPPVGPIAPTKVFYVDVSPPTNGMQIALGIRDRMKKSKDLKYAWKRFVNLATSKFQGMSPTNGGLKNEVRGEYDLVDKTLTLSDTMDRDDGIASMSTCDDSITTLPNDGKTTIEILSRTPSNSSSDMMQKPSKTDMDYGYISADSNDFKAQKKRLYARFNFKMDKNTIEPSTSKAMPGVSTQRNWRQRHLHRMQEIKENSESDRNSVSSTQHGVKQTITKPMISAPINTTMPMAQLNDFVPKALVEDDSVEVRVYSSSDDDRYSSGMSSESDGEYNVDELCESGAESIETHSVLFKNIRKLNENN